MSLKVKPPDGYRLLKTGEWIPLGAMWLTKAGVWVLSEAGGSGERYGLWGESYRGLHSPLASYCAPEDGLQSRPGPRCKEQLPED